MPPLVCRRPFLLRFLHSIFVSAQDPYAPTEPRQQEVVWNPLQGCRWNSYYQQKLETVVYFPARPRLGLVLIPMLIYTNGIEIPSSPMAKKLGVKDFIEKQDIKEIDIRKGDGR